MFVSDKIVFMELQKTGCTHIRNLLQSLVGGRFVERHNQADPDLFTAGRTFLGSIRNPWDWYVSLWAYGCDRRGDLFRNTTTPGLAIRKRGWRRHAFSALRDLLESRPNRHAMQWRRTYRDSGDAGAFREWLYMVHDSSYRADLGEGYWRTALGDFAGLLTYRYLRLFACRNGELPTLRAIATPAQLAEHERRRCFIRHFIRNERLELDLIAALEETGFRIGEQDRAEVMSRPRTNTSSRRHAAVHYYDPASARLVADRERLIVDRFGYAAPGVAG